MRLTNVVNAACMAVGMFVMLQSGAIAGAKSDDSFSVCDPDAIKTLRLDQQKPLTRADVAQLMQLHWPTIKTIVASKGAMEFFSLVLSEDANKEMPGPLDTNTIGLIHDLFAKNTNIGGDGYILHSTTPGPNTKLSTVLLRQWATASDADAPTISCQILNVANNDEKKSQGLQSLLDKIWSYRDNIRLRDSAADLTQALGNHIDTHFPSPSNSQASIAFHHDQLDHSANTFTMHVALGGEIDLFDKKGDDPDKMAALLFIAADRVNNASPTAMKNNSTDLSAGFGMVWLGQSENWSWRTNMQVQGDTDDHFAASILYVGGQASVWPNSVPCFSSAPQYLNLFRLECGLNFDLDFANIFNKGDFSNLGQRQYSRAGFDVNAKILAPNLSDAYLGRNGDGLHLLYGFFSNFSLNGSYKSLQDLTGSGAGLSRFNASINYDLSGSDDTQSTALSLSYVNGRADRTLQPERAWELSLKAAF